jgi:hypothetical protein
MRKDLKTQNLALLISFLFFLGTGGAFFWLWKTSQPAAGSVSTVDEQYITVEIGSVKKEAEDLLKSKDNLVQMPLVAPTEKVGRDNPFSAASN